MRIEKTEPARSQLRELKNLQGPELGNPKKAQIRPREFKKCQRQELEISKKAKIAKPPKSQTECMIIAKSDQMARIGISQNPKPNA